MTTEARLVVRRGDFGLNLACDVADGETLALLGANGSGKTTVLRALAGLTPISAGSITIDGVVMDDGAAVFRPPEDRPVGMVFQNYALMPHLTVLQNVSFGLRTRRGRAELSAELGWRVESALPDAAFSVGNGTLVNDRVSSMLERFDLTDLANRYPAQLSGGQAQRVALARSLLPRPRLLLLDEPVAALDVAARIGARRELKGHLGNFDGMTVVVSHDPLDVYALADRVAIVEGGRIIQSGTVGEVTAHPRSRFVAEMVGTNLVSGTVSSDGLLTDNGVLLAVVADFSGAGYACIRPQSVTLARADADLLKGSARNAFGGTIEEITSLADRVRVRIDGELTLVAEITPGAAAELELAVGDQCHALIKATDVAVYPA